MAKKLLVFLSVLTLVVFVACKKEETTNIDATTDTAGETSMTSSETVVTDTMSTDTMSTDAMGTDTSSTSTTSGTTSTTTT